MRRLAGWVIAALVALLLIAGPASAHSELESSNPESGAQLDAPPSSIMLTFNEQLQGQTATLGVLAGDNDPVQVEGSVQGATVTLDATSGPLAEIIADGADGKWAIGYQVVSADGHPIDGTLTFTVGDAGGEGDAGSASSGGPGDSATARAEGEDGVTWWQLLLILAGSPLVVFLVVKTDRVIRKKRNPPAGRSDSL